MNHNLFSNMHTHFLFLFYHFPCLCKQDDIFVLSFFCLRLSLFFRIYIYLRQCIFNFLLFFQMKSESDALFFIFFFYSWLEGILPTMSESFRASSYSKKKKQVNILTKKYRIVYLCVRHFILFAYHSLFFFLLLSVV